MPVTVVPCGMPAPCTGWPTKNPRLLGTVTCVLPLLVAVICEMAAGAAKFAVVGVPPVSAAADKVTTPVVGL